MDDLEWGPGIKILGDKLKPIFQDKWQEYTLTSSQEKSTPYLYVKSVQKLLYSPEVVKNVNFSSVENAYSKNPALNAVRNSQILNNFY